MKVIESFDMLTLSVFNRNVMVLSVVQLLKGYLNSGVDGVLSH